MGHHSHKAGLDDCLYCFTLSIMKSKAGTVEQSREESALLVLYPQHLPS